MDKRTRLGHIGFIMAVVSLCSLAGCDFFKTDNDRWLAPEKVIRARGKDLQMVQGIRLNISPADQETELVPNAKFPLPSDLQYNDDDYVISASDIVDISVLDLFSEGLETILRRQVTESGFVDLPLLPDRVKAEGLTKEGLTERLKEAYSPDIIIKPTISVTVIAQRGNAFSILGAVERPSQYSIIRRDMRLLGALALAGGITQSNIRYIYVIRQRPPVAVKSGKTKPKTATELPPLPEIPKNVENVEDTEDTQDALRELLDTLGTDGDDDSSSSTSRPATSPTPSVMPHFSETTSVAGASTSAPATTSTPDTTSAPATAVQDVEDKRGFKPVWVNGKWVQVPQDVPATASATPGEQQKTSGTVSDARETDPMDPFQWGKAGSAGLARVIAIDLTQLRNGNADMNIVVRDKDVIHVPSLEIGEFYIMGEVLRPGVYSLTGRQITVKQAIAASGNLGPLAWPENSVLIRRVGSAEEQTIPLNIEKIFAGTESDVFLKANDLIAVGTNIRASFFAVIRNAFRMTYGFGFIYDRNFANPSFSTGRTDSTRFSRW